ncbi:unnamed protein product [Calypogeia fissa]
MTSKTSRSLLGLTLILSIAFDFYRLLCVVLEYSETCHSFLAVFANLLAVYPTDFPVAISTLDVAGSVAVVLMDLAAIDKIARLPDVTISATFRPAFLHAYKPNQVSHPGLIVLWYMAPLPKMASSFHPLLLCCERDIPMDVT